MRQFKDCEARPWAVEVNTFTALRLKEVLALDIAEVVTGDLLDKLGANPLMLLQAVAVAVEGQIAERNMDADAFFKAVKGQAIEDAFTAFAEELIDYFPPERAAFLRELWTTAQEAEAETWKEATAKAKDPSVKAAMLSALRKSGTSSGS